MADWYSLIHLDRMVEVTGAFVAGDTQWTLPFIDDTLDTIVLGQDFGANAGDILTPDTNTNGGVVIEDADYSAGEVIIGRSYPMSVQLTRPFYRNEGGVADFDAFLVVQRIAAIYHNTGGLRVRVDYPDLSTYLAERSESLDVDPLKDDGSLIAWFSGRAQDMRIFVENTTCKPCTVPTVEIVCNYQGRIHE